ncbi:MAG: bifunctional (p)ppGpp synthetase/guanosine-3',5'-bis(diphosphate) 3'-pyrophosphohydrolase [Acidobacteriaceae bacterium]|nr:bifunctional (p)ppGpp synthetase/guanosine-3',5'-bis(diphosphate) 3'-pyrophosphohydrolase [Acidobacteriaceae bacterium]MBV9780418.1 bifunctional (p)ppGpp synthetase/guanosine-3',5'-bis(diphosphate) 3'-pyrophosphohydrolase [Acidobacteriaceae bacterium]
MSTTLLAEPQIDQLYKSLQEKVRSRRPNEDLSGLENAYRFALHAHDGQRRDSGEPYITHPLAVADLLADMQMDLVTLETGLLHDVLEDTKTKPDDLKERFGEDVARCVDGVTKLTKISLANREDRQAESLRKMLLAMTSDIRVIIVKLADRLHNLRTISALPRDKQEAIAQETIDIYAPIAHRLGMGKIRGALEDLAFETLQPEAAAELMREIESKRQENEEWVRQIQTEIAQRLTKETIPARVDGRVKRAYSVYSKLKRQRITLDQVYDLLAVRIITDSVKNCYAALGVIHNEWHPIPDRIKDFIAMPRPNLYQSLHTSVIGPGGVAFEVQIRTEEMHRNAEEGIAAHWKYKEGSKGPGQDDQRIAWLRQLMEWQREMRDSGDFLSTLKVDLYPEEVYTFTPKGRVIVLPRDATPIDFAYAIHTDVGNSCVGARVNGAIKPLKYALRNGDVVEILTQPGHQPSKDWLGVVKTSRARNKIKHVINTAERAKAVEIGQKSLEKEARRLGLNLGRFSRDDFENVASEYGVSKTEDLLAALGFGRFSARQVLQKVAADDVIPEPPAAPVPSLPPRVPQLQPGLPPGDLTIHVKGVDDVLVYRAKCCNPIRGEQIVGYITRGKGVAVHSVQCPNVQAMLYESERKIDVEWARSASEPLPVKVVIFTDDRPGILNQLTSILSAEQSNIRTLEARGDQSRTDDSAIVDITMEVRDKKQLERVITAFRRVPGVRDIERVRNVS